MQGFKMPIQLAWTIGVNNTIFDNAYTLSDDNLRKEIFYTSGHNALLYNMDKHEQKILQGHTNIIHCTCVSDDKRWLVTCDQGKESMIIVWDSIKAIPIKTIFDPHPNVGVRSIHISNDSLYIVSLSNSISEDDSQEQTVNIWDWTSDSNSPLVSYTFHNHGHEHHVIKFHPSNPKYLLSNSTKSITFYSWKEGHMKAHSPPCNPKELRLNNVPLLTRSTYILNSTMAATGTKQGDIILWNTDALSSSFIEKTALKVVKVHENASVNVIYSMMNYIVTGGSDGNVRFFDHQLRLEAWFESLNEGSIHSISFEKSIVQSLIQLDTARSTLSQQQQQQQQSSNKETQIHASFKCPHFIVSTSNAVILQVNSQSFDDMSKSQSTVLVRGCNAPVQTIACHPSKPFLAISGFTSQLQIFDYQRKKMLFTSSFKDLYISKLRFEPKGEYLIAGSTCGTIKVLHGNKFSELQSIKVSKASIVDISFSHNSVYFAFSDSDHCVGIFKWTHQDQDERKPVEYVYLGRYKSHKSPIVGIQFGMSEYGDNPRLFSAGEDRRLIEYDLDESSIVKGIKVKALHKIGQQEVPTAFLWTRSNQQFTSHDYQPTHMEEKFVFANDAYKFNVYVVPDSSKDTKCVNTFLCPTFGGPLNRLLYVPASTTSKLQPSEDSFLKYIIYTTHEKVIGVINLPIDGNPHRYVGVIAHSDRITDAECSSDGTLFFSAGGTDNNVNIWKINGEVLSQDFNNKMKNYDLNGGKLEPFVELIDGGRSGDFYSEMQQYFYYAQIRSQGEITTAERKISGKVPLDQIPDIARAVGFYGSELEMQNLMTEIKHVLGYGHHHHQQDHHSNLSNRDIFVDFDTFLKIYVNHRPIVKVQQNQIQQAFVTLGADSSTGIINNELLFRSLMNNGEVMEYEHVNEILSTLMGENVTYQDLEDHFSSEEFMKHILGFE